MDTKEIRALAQVIEDAKNVVADLDRQVKEQKSIIRDAEDRLIWGLVEDGTASVAVNVESRGVEIVRQLGIRREIWPQVTAAPQEVVKRLIELPQHHGLLMFATQSSRSFLAGLEEEHARERGQERYTIKEIAESHAKEPELWHSAPSGEEGESSGPPSRVMTPEWIPEELKEFLRVREKLALQFRKK